MLRLLISRVRNSKALVKPSTTIFGIRSSHSSAASELSSPIPPRIHDLIGGAFVDSKSSASIDPAADNLDKAIKIVNKTRYGNAAYRYTTSGTAAGKFQTEIGAGRQVGINVPIPVALPFLSFYRNKASLAGDLNSYDKASVNSFPQVKTVTQQRKNAPVNLIQSLLLNNVVLYHINNGIQGILADYVHHKMSRELIVQIAKVFYVIALKDTFLFLMGM